MFIHQFKFVYVTQKKKNLTGKTYFRGFSNRDMTYFKSVNSRYLYELFAYYVNVE